MMNNNIFQIILKNKVAKHKMLAILLDPDQCRNEHLTGILNILKTHKPDFIFVGGSHTTFSTEILIEQIKQNTAIDIVLFPGDASQFSAKADALLYLSLISGRNPEYLIGQHVNSSLAIKESGIEVIPTAYILVEGGSTSSVEYMSTTKAIPRCKYNIALSTAMAGELLGLQIVYLEAGSGAELSVPDEMIKIIRNELSIPIIVGGGIKTLDSLQKAYDAGADLVVIGNAFETEPNKIQDFVEFVEKYNKQN